MDAVKRVAYLGPAGTNTEVAAIQFYPSATHVPYLTIGAIAASVASGDVDAGLAAIENSLQGTITDTVDALIRDEAIAVCGEIVLAIQHCLMAAPGTRREAIDVIYSHPQSLGQCRRYLEANFPRARTEAALSNAVAVEIAMKTPAAAAIGPARAAQIYGAEIL
ncbi:MAG TPA: prephenate dehydratase domain-containing protein, partial [Dehalococcoidia bacterium]